MNILFLTMNPFTGIDMHNIYSDLMVEFIKNGHKPYIVTPREKRTGEVTALTDYGDHAILKVQTGNMSGVSLVEKGISQLTLSGRYYRAIKKQLGHIAFDLILYSTPPITLVGPVRKLKKHLGARTYLMLKDIFPQNAVDLGMFSPKSPIYGYFRMQEKALYRVSDRIGCMSPANVDYVRRNNPKLGSKLELCPNAVIPCALQDRTEDKRALRERFAIPEDAVVYLYGGNLGKPQGIPFLVECLNANRDRADRYFIICGSGSESGLLETFAAEAAPSNVRFLPFLPKAEYDALVRGCDVGLIFLDHRFTIPNYPSRILSYMENAMPVVVCTDRNSDMGSIAEENGYGLWCESSDAAAFTKLLDRMDKQTVEALGTAAREYLLDNYTADKVYAIIMEGL